MKVGDLVFLKKPIVHATGIYLPGAVGIVLGTQEPTIKDARAYADVDFRNKEGRHNKVTCYWDELEVANESR